MDVIHCVPDPDSIEYAIGFIVVEQQLPSGRWIGHMVIPRYPSTDVQKVVNANAGYGAKHRYAQVGLEEGRRLSRLLCQGKYRSIF